MTSARCVAGVLPVWRRDQAKLTANGDADAHAASDGGQGINGKKTGDVVIIAVGGGK
jgi:hypothetical protein